MFHLDRSIHRVHRALGQSLPGPRAPHADRTIDGPVRGEAGTGDPRHQAVSEGPDPFPKTDPWLGGLGCDCRRRIAAGERVQVLDVEGQILRVENANNETVTQDGRIPGFTLFVIALLVFTAVTAWKGVRIVPQGEEWVVERLGKYRKPWSRSPHHRAVHRQGRLPRDHQGHHSRRRAAGSDHQGQRRDPGQCDRLHQGDRYGESASTASSISPKRSAI